MLSRSLIPGTLLVLLLSEPATAACNFSSPDNTSAPVVKNNTENIYTATLLDKNNTAVRGTFTAFGAANGVGINFQVELTGVPDNTTFLNYHIHQNPVPENGSCKDTGDHLDPYERGIWPPCNATEPQTCQVGDISGKHGPVWTPSGGFNITYSDFFLSNVPDTPSFFGNRSIVVHLPSNDRINCGNFTGLKG